MRKYNAMHMPLKLYLLKRKKESNITKQNNCQIYLYIFRIIKILYECTSFKNTA